MARGAIQVKIEGQYDDKDLNRAIRDLERLKKESGSTQGGVTGLANGLKGLAIAAAGAFTLNELVGFMKDATAAAAADQKSMVALATAMDNVGLSSQNAMAEDFIKRMMLATGVADDELRPALQSLITATGSLETAQSALSLAQDVSVGTGRSLSQVSQALVRAYSGQTTGLSRLGAGLDSALLKSKDMDAITAALSSKFGGQAAAAAETYAGKMQRVQTAAGEAQETIGYALLNALEDVTDALGGTNGLVGSIDATGESIANLITGTVDFLKVGADLLKWVNDMTGATDESNGGFVETLLRLNALLPGGAAVSGMYQGLIDRGAEINAEQARMEESMRGATAQAMLEGRAVSDAAREHSGLATTADVAADAVERLDEKFKEIKGNLSDQAAIDNYQIGLRKIREELDKSSRSLSVNTDAGAKNRDAIIGLFNDAATAAQAWGNKTGASTAEIEAKFATMTGNIRQRLINEGFSAKDIDKFLGGMGLWDASTRGMIRSAAAAAQAEAKAVAVSKFTGIGLDLAKGLLAGMQSGQVYVDAGIRQVIRNAEAAARAEAESNSPSRVFARVGSDLVEGIIVGLESKKEAVKAKSSEVAQGVIDAGRKMIDGWDSELGRLQGIYDDAVSQFNSFKDSITGDIFGELNLGAAVDEAKKTGESVVSALTSQAGGIGRFAQNMIDLTKTNLSEAAWMAVKALGAERGTDISNAMLGSQGQTIIDGVNKIYADVATMADAVGLAAATKWRQKGVEQAQATYEGFRDNFGEGGPARKALMGLMDNLSRAMDRSATITITTVNRVINETVGKFGGGRASGGPVAANTAYLVGEQGPELLVMGSQSGSIVPSVALPSARGGGAGMGGSTYAITVNAGVGDPRAIGQQVVEAITRYERANGPVYAKAS